MNFKYKEFPNIGYMEIMLTDEELDPIKQEIKKIELNFNSAVEHNDKLVGNISKEFRLLESCRNINDLVFKYLKEYDNITDYTQKISVLTNDCPMIIDNPWVNFQKKYEFNPPHKHTGVISFVIWIQIPYDIQDEKNSEASKKSLEPLAGNFSFHYTNALGEIYHYHIPADKSMENKMLIFPAGLNHSVSPFYTSDDYRISISGNVKFLT